MKMYLYSHLDFEYLHVTHKLDCLEKVWKQLFKKKCIYKCFAFKVLKDGDYFL